MTSGASLVFCVTQTLGVSGSWLFVGLLSRFSSMGDGGIQPLITPKRKAAFPRYQVTLLMSGCQIAQVGTEQVKFLVNSCC